MEEGGSSLVRARARARVHAWQWLGTFSVGFVLERCIAVDCRVSHFVARVETSHVYCMFCHSQSSAK